ncbi:hypothetical protein ACFWJM_11870 [Streptomyces sp. NPDC127077]|uniref:hypothetical protein n=1 Tax=Streptomyces sp. NPDC127077 TaxID=3347131 RepID=UPI003660DF47
MPASSEILAELSRLSHATSLAAVLVYALKSLPDLLRVGAEFLPAWSQFLTDRMLRKNVAESLDAATALELLLRTRQAPSVAPGQQAAAEALDPPPDRRPP